MSKKILVVAAHIGDFVWRCGGTIAKYVSNGDTVRLIVLTYGARGEANSYWKKEGATMEECKQIRHAEGIKAAEILGIEKIDILDYEDYPLQLDKERIETLACMVREFGPDIILTHDNEVDPYNTDHTLLGEKIYEVCAVAASAGIKLNDLSPVKRPAIYGFEPHVSEISNFKPAVYIDITAVQAKKEEAMTAYATQKNMLTAYITRAKIRAQQAKIKNCVYAEAFSYKKAFVGQDFFTN